MRFFAIRIGNETINPPGNIPSGGTATFEQVLKIGIELLFIVAVVLSLIFIIWGGISWIISGGDKEALQKARKKITFAIIGLVVVLLAFLIVSFTGGFIGVDLIGR